MANILEYKGYFTKIEYSREDGVLFGKIEGINDFVNFESPDIRSIESAFRQAVDDYLVQCKAAGKKPDKAYKGSFNVRVAPELHKKLALLAAEKGESLNKAVEDAINAYLNRAT